jgi:ATP-binding cassette subfamily F protein 3
VTRRHALITNISIRIAGRLLIDSSSAQIVPGASASSAQRASANPRCFTPSARSAAGSRQHPIPPRWRIGSLAQEAPDGPESLIEVVLRADLERDALLREAETADDPHRIAEIQTRLVDIDARRAARAYPQRPQVFDRRSGARMRRILRRLAHAVALAATLFSAPDLLLLDGPQLSRSRRHAVAGRSSGELSAHRDRHQP